MKKNFLVVLMLVLFSTFCLTACNLSSSIEGNFKQSQYLISLEEGIDFYDELNVKGVEKNKIVFSSSNENILASDENGFYGLASGSAYVFANYDNKIIAKSQVYVKHRLAAPQNIYVNEDNGLVSWDKSFAIVDGVKVEASSYAVRLNMVGQENKTEFITKTNSFELSSVGSYQVEIIASSTNTKVDPSSANQYIVNYGVMSWEGNEIEFNVERKFNQKLMLSWQEVSNACFDVFVDGIKMASDLRSNYFEIDLSKYEGERNISVEVVIKDVLNIKAPASKLANISILKEPEIEYDFNEDSGLLKCEYSQNASGFLLEIKNLENNEVCEKYFARFGNIFLNNILGLDKGIYEVRLIAVGGKQRDVIYVNSKFSNTIRVGKLEMPKPQVSFEGSKVILNFEEDSYLSKYMISCGEENLLFDTSSSLTCEIDLANLEKGSHSLSVSALPSTENDRVKELEIGGYSSSNVLNSDDFVFNFFKLAELGSIKHTLDEGYSYFEFDQIENANTYLIYLDGNLIESEMSITEENKVVLKVYLYNIKQFAPIDDIYNFEIVAIYIEDEIQHSFKSSKIKQLEVLSAVSASEEQINGSFKWEILDKECGYSYKIYKANKNFEILDINPYIINESYSNTILETLEEGYYVIRVASISKDYDRYLDSDFYNSDNILTQTFIVTKKIETPHLRIEQTDQPVLIISSVEYGGEYKVYVDGRLDGTISVSNIQEEITYKFNDTLSEAKDYKISVVAGGGKLHDNTIYLNSDEAEIIVTRLARPNQTITDIYADFDQLLGQKLQVENIEGSRAVEFSLNGEKYLETDQFYIDMIDKTKFGSEFKIGITLLAGYYGESHFYINSLEKEINFKRVSPPISIDYDNGYITWQNDDNRVRDYYLSIILQNSNSSDYYYRFKTSTLDNRLNLQSNIDALCKSSIEFMTAYRQAEKVAIEMISYRNDFDGSNYLLPSLNGGTKEIYHLEKVNLSFDTENKIISWDCDIPGTTFDIYFDDERQPFVADYKRNDYDISQILHKFASQKKITVLAKNTKYLSSEISDAIFIKQLSTPKTISIEKIGDSYKATFEIKSDSAFIENVLIGGSIDNVDYEQGSNFASFNPKLFSGDRYSIKLLAKNQGNKNYYIDSEEIVYTLVDLNSSAFSGEIGADSISWTKVAQDMIGNNIDPIIYQVSVTSDGKTKTINLQDEDNLLLDKLEEMLGITIKHDAQIEIKAIVDRAYTIAYRGNCKGYYGESQSIILSTQKLEMLDKIDYSIEEADVLNKIERKTNSSLNLIFDDKWSGIAGIKFAVTIKGSADSFVFYPVLNSASDNYTFNLKDGSYRLKISPKVLSQFESGEIEIIIQVKKDEFISSDQYILTLPRLNLVSKVLIDDDGNLLINDDQNANYLAEIIIEDSIIEVDMLSDKTLSLLDERYILNKKGAFSVKIIAYDNDNRLLSSQRAMVFNGYKLEGIENIEIDDKGIINFTLFKDDLADLVFVAKRGAEEIEFVAEQDENNDNKFSLPMIELLKMFDPSLSMEEGIENFSFAIKKKGSIKSNYYDTLFNFAIEKNQPVLASSYQNEKDYILFDIIEEDINTLSFRLTIKAKNWVSEENDENQEDSRAFEERVITKIISAADIFGYWVVDEEGRAEFKTVRPTESGVIATEKYALDLSLLLAEVDYGDIEIEVSRIARSENMIQYKSSKFNLTKLNTINNDQTLYVAKNYLNFKWQSIDNNMTANSFIVYFERDGRSLSYNTSVSSVDLRNVGLVAGQPYNIYVVAVNNDKDIIASNRSSASCQTIQFTKPTTLEVKNGKLQFNQDTFENSMFIKDMLGYFAETNPSYVYHEEMGEREYKDLFYFTPGYLDRFNITLRFNRIEDGKLTNKVYSLTTKAYNLFPDLKLPVTNKDYTDYLGDEESLSYTKLLSLYSMKNLQGNESVKATNVRLMSEALSKSTNGIGDNGYLFDDAGRDIPAGEYFVSIFENDYQQYVESQNSEGVRMYLSAAPKIDLTNFEIDGKTNYFANVKLASTMIPDADNGYTSALAQRYKLQLRKHGEIATASSSVVEFLIEYDEVGGTWMISYKDNILEGVLLQEEGGLPNFKINMTKLRRSLLDLNENVIAINQLYQADIFVYNQDNGFVINGKSGIFNIRYLDLRAEDIHFENGNFIVETKSEGFELLVKYKKQSTEERSRTIRFINGRAEINLSETGGYEYVILSLNGSYSNSEINVESFSYLIADVYKLSSPSLSVSNGSINIGYNKSDSNNCGNLSFYMANDVSLAEDYQGQDKDYYYQSLIMENQNIPLYRVGSTDENGDVKYLSELSAQTYFAYLAGNSGQFIIDENLNTLSDYILSFASGERPMLSSVQTSINARMLNAVDVFDIYNGDIRIEDDSQIEIFDKNNNQAKLLYEIKIEYFYKDNTDPNKLIFANDEIIYSEKSDAEDVMSQYISGKMIKSDYLFYKFSVTVVPAKLAQEGQSGEKVTTIEGNVYRLSEGLMFEDGGYALRSLSRTIDSIITRTNPANLASKSNGISNGKINFVIDRTVYFSGNQDNIASDTAKRIAVQATYTSQGKEKTVLLSGEYSFSTSTVSGEENNVYVSFLPDDGQLNDVARTISFSIYLYGIDDKGQNAIMSVPLLINDVYKLEKIDQRYYSIVLADGKTGIDFSNYFASVAIADNRDCYKIVINYLTEEGEKSITLTNKSDSKVFVLPENITKLSFQAQDAQSSQEVNIKKLLYSDTENLKVDSTSIEELEISYNAELMRFEWNWPEENQNNYQYYVSLYISGSFETIFTTDNFYAPRNTGTIYPNSFKLKARILGDDESSISIFSEEKVFENESNIECRPFSGGNGSQEKPYQIASKQDFANIRLRNTNDFYFKLVSNIEINSDENMLSEENFNGHLNGDGYKISFTSSNIYKMDKITQYLIGFDNDSLEFDSYSALFKSVSAGAEVKNLNINHNINFSSVNDSKTLFASICAFNYGNINNVNLTEFNISLEGNNASMANNIFVGGVAGYNYNKITNCKNTSIMSFVMPQALSFNFGYAAIALFNSSVGGNVGEISNCFNSGDKKISVATSNNNFYMAGITLSNVGKISVCGNDGKLTVTSRTSNVSSINCYFAGITITSTNGVLEYLYNNGRISSEAPRGNFVYSGIVYQIIGGSINTLVETQSNQPIARSYQTNPIDYGNHYASNNSGTVMNIQVKELAETQLQCSESQYLEIKKTEDGYIASIKTI